MSQTVLVTGVTGLAGATSASFSSNTATGCRLWHGREPTPVPSSAWVWMSERATSPTATLCSARATGADAAVHCAALLGGASQNLADFQAVNVDGTRHVLDAAHTVGMRRVVAVSTGTFFDTTGGLAREDAPVSKSPSSDPYTLTKMAAFEDASARAAADQDVVTTHPGAIFGPSPVVTNAVGITSFNRVLISALRGRLTRYLRFPVSWVFADDVARGCLLALDRGVAGERYMLDGRPEDVMSVAEAGSLVCALAGLEQRVEDIEPSDDPELVRVFGPTLVAIASKSAGDRPARIPHTESKTYKRLGYQPNSLEDGLLRTINWLRDIGKID